MKQRKLLSQRHPALYFLAVWTRRFLRYTEWYFDRKKYARKKTKEKLPYRIKKHQSVLLKKLGVSDMQLQINKVTNLKIATKQIDGIIIRPGETFSFCRLVGHPTKRKGYRPGMELTFGQARAGIGGGICQISNLIHWLVIHSPLTVTERYHHSFDPFPDDGRVLPFGSGATVFYNYRDYQFTNNTPYTFQINLWFSEKCLEGELRIDAELDYVYHVFEKDHEFLKKDGQFYRKNEIWREKALKYKSGQIVETELITKNFARVTYTPDYYTDQLLSWQYLKDNIYYWDGSWRDIYVLNTSKEDWNRWVDYVNEKYLIDWFNGKNNQAENKVNFKIIEEYWSGNHDYCSTAKVFIGKTQLNAHFFSEDEIENDIDPREFNSMEDHEKIIEYMKDISFLFNKEVILTEESMPGIVLIKVNKDIVEFNFKL